MNSILRASAFLATLVLAAALINAQSLLPKWEDLTSAKFVKALQQSNDVCMLPNGSVEMFGPSGQLGTNLYFGLPIYLLPGCSSVHVSESLVHLRRPANPQDELARMPM
jgi:hypothetical protein